MSGSGALQKNLEIVGTIRHRRGVVLVVGITRGVGAEAAMVLVLSGCGAAEAAMTTTSPPPEAAVNPWDLPLEERPALFDPCTEIPIEAIEEALGEKAEPIGLFTRHQPGSLMVCGWSSEEADLSILSTWKSRNDYADDRSFTVVDPKNKVSGRNGLRVTDNTDASERGCIQILFTSRGAVWVQLELYGVTKEFRNQRIHPCEALEQALNPLVGLIPNGDF